MSKVKYQSALTYCKSQYIHLQTSLTAHTQILTVNNIVAQKVVGHKEIKDLKNMLRNMLIYFLACSQFLWQSREALCSTRCDMTTSGLRLSDACPEASTQTHTKMQQSWSTTENIVYSFTITALKL